MGFLDFLNTPEAVLGIDLGSQAIKLIEFDTTSAKPIVTRIGLEPLSEEVFQSHAISRIDLVGERLLSVTDRMGISTKFAACALPGAAVFTKKIKLNKVPREELWETIQLEAANFIPHNIDAIKLDYSVLAETGKDQLEVLVIAVKGEILESFTDSLLAGGFEAMVVDVDHFAVQNCFELNYPEMTAKTVAVVNIGSRLTTVNICRAGVPLFTGDIGIGGRHITENIATETGMSFADAEALKRSCFEKQEQHPAVQKQVEFLAAELHRQLSFFWNASGAEEAIERIYLAGGGSLLRELVATVAKRTGIETEQLDPFRAVQWGEGVDGTSFQKMAPAFAVAVGLGLRQAGDKIFPEGV